MAQRAILSERDGNLNMAPLDESDNFPIEWSAIWSKRKVCGLDGCQNLMNCYPRIISKRPTNTILLRHDRIHEIEELRDTQIRDSSGFGRELDYPSPDFFVARVERKK
jgi:hypothetical protein